MFLNKYQFQSVNLIIPIGTYILISFSKLVLTPIHHPSTTLYMDNAQTHTSKYFPLKKTKNTNLRMQSNVFTSRAKHRARNIRSSSVWAATIKRNHVSEPASTHKYKLRYTEIKNNINILKIISICFLWCAFVYFARIRIINNIDFP